MHVILYTLTQRKSICVCMFVMLCLVCNEERDRDGWYWGKESLKFLVNLSFSLYPCTSSFPGYIIFPLSLHVSSYVCLPLNVYPTSETLTCPHHYSVSKHALPVVLGKWLIFSWRRWLISHRWHQLHPWLSCAPMMTVSFPPCLCLFLCTIKLPMPLWLHVSFITHTLPSLFLSLWLAPTIELNLQLALLHWYFSTTAQQLDFSASTTTMNTPSTMPFRKCCKGLLGFYIGFDLCRFQFWVLFSLGARHASPSFCLLWPALISPYIRKIWEDRRQ